MLDPWYGLQIATDASLTERKLYPRSPARAKRRAARGFPQHTREVPAKTAYRIGNRLVMHPSMYAALKKQMEGA